MTMISDTRGQMIWLVATALIGCTSLKDPIDRADPHDADVTDDGGNDGGVSGQSGMSGAGGSGGDLHVEPVRPTTTGFSTLGMERHGAGATLRDDGFELHERRCTAGGKLCVTGGFQP